MSEKLIHALCSSHRYPHRATRIKMLETHISWVLLTGEFVYKIKKPVNFGFLDFSTLAMRKYYCEEEVRLNSRFSSGLYLAVVAITGSEDDPFVGGEGEILDYAVKMREFDQNDLLERLAAEKALGIDDIKSLAKKLAAFHRDQAARLDDGEETLGTVASVANATLENFRQIMPQLTTAAARQALEGLQQWSEQQLAVLHQVLTERRTGGFVRECHGDLHLRNIARIDGVVTFFDCIEFNPQFRWIDVQSELAFLLMDMEYKQLHALSNRLLNVYLEYSGDYQGLAVLQFYKVYRAMVRAKAIVLKVAGGGLSQREQDEAWREYDGYIRLAQVCCQPRQAFLGLMHGISGTGKSTVAAVLAGELGAIRIRSDVERKRLFGLAPDASSGAEDKEQLYGEAGSRRTFAALESLAHTLLCLGYPVLVDATFIAARRRTPFLRLAEDLQLPFAIIDCQASRATIEQRLALRKRKQGGESEAGVAEMRNQLATQEEFTADEKPHVLVVDTERAVDAGELRQFLTR